MFETTCIEDFLRVRIPTSIYLGKGLVRIKVAELSILVRTENEGPKAGLPCDSPGVLGGPVVLLKDTF